MSNTWKNSFPSIHHWIHLPIHQEVCLSPCHHQAENLLKFPGNNGEKNAVNYQHKIPVKSPSVQTLSVTSVIAAVCALSIPSIHPSDDEHQEILDKFPGTNYGETSPSEIKAKFPDNVTLTLCNVKFLEKTSGNVNGAKNLKKFLSG